MFDHGEYIGTFLRQDIEAKYGIPHTSVTRAASTGERIRKRYTFECVQNKKETEKESMKAWAKEWNSVRTEIKTKLGWA